MPNYSKRIQKQLKSVKHSQGIIMEVGDRLLVFLKVVSSNVTRGTFCTIYDMKAVEMIKEFSYAVVVSKPGCVML